MNHIFLKRKLVTENVWVERRRAGQVRAIRCPQISGAGHCLNVCVCVFGAMNGFLKPIIPVRPAQRSPTVTDSSSQGSIITSSYGLCSGDTHTFIKLHVFEL